MKQITPQEADAGIRASWPRPFIETTPIDYGAHTAECFDGDDYAPRPRMTLMDVVIVITLGAAAWALVAGVVALVQKVAT